MWKPRAESGSWKEKKKGGYLTLPLYLERRREVKKRAATERNGKKGILVLSLI